MINIGLSERMVYLHINIQEIFPWTVLKILLIKLFGKNYCKYTYPNFIWD